MAITLREFVHKIGYVVSTEGLDEADKILEQSFEKIKDMNRGINKMADSLSKIGRNLTIGLSLPIGALATTSVLAKIKLEDMIKEWEVLLGSKERGRAFVNEIMRLEEEQPFETEQILAYAKELRRLGYVQEEIIPTFKRFSDIAAARGVPIGDIMNRIAMIRNIGYVTSMDLKYFIRSGIIERREMEKITGRRGKDLYKYAATGKITADIIDRVFIRMGERYAGSAAERANTLGKAFKNVADSIFRLRAVIGDAIVRMFRLDEVLKKIANVIERITENLRTMPQWIKNVVITIGLLLFILGPTIWSLSVLIKTLLGLKAAMAFFAAMGPATKGFTMINASLLVMLGRFTLIGTAVAAIILAVQDLYTFFKHGPEHSLLGGFGYRLGQEAAQRSRQIKKMPGLSGLNIPGPYGMGGIGLGPNWKGGNTANVNIEKIEIGVPAGSSQEQKDYIFRTVKEAAVTSYDQMIRRFNEQIFSNLKTPVPLAATP